jgi:hypothetical protein
MSAPKALHRSWALVFIRNCLLWLLPAALLWALATPFYNRFLLVSAENLVHLTESPNVTDLLRQDDHFAYVSRRDFPPSKSLAYSFRVTDVHFPLGDADGSVPRRPASTVASAPGEPRLGSAGDCVLRYRADLLPCEIRLRDRPRRLEPAHYGALPRNFWGLGKHLLDLPLKFSLPFLLWSGFYLGKLSPIILNSPRGIT